jgi:hypothetical protein
VKGKQEGERKHSQREREERGQCTLTSRGER